MQLQDKSVWAKALAYVVEYVWVIPLTLLLCSAMMFSTIAVYFRDATLLLWAFFVTFIFVALSSVIIFTHNKEK